MLQGSPRGELAVTNNPIHQSVIIHSIMTEYADVPTPIEGWLGLRRDEGRGKLR
jgi:hypothetical protein